MSLYSPLISNAQVHFTLPKKTFQMSYHIVLVSITYSQIIVKVKYTKKGKYKNNLDFQTMSKNQRMIKVIFLQKFSITAIEVRKHRI